MDLKLRFTNQRKAYDDSPLHEGGEVALEQIEGKIDAKLASLNENSCSVCLKPLGEKFGTCLCSPSQGQFHLECDPHPTRRCDPKDKFMPCDMCGERKKDVSERSNSYANDVGNDSTAMHTVCDECDYQNIMDI